MFISYCQHRLRRCLGHSRLCSCFEHSGLNLSKSCLAPPGLGVRGVLLAKVPDSSFSGVPVGYCPDEVHMEEEGVQVQVQAEEEEIGETHGREQGEEKGRENKQSLKRMTWMTMRMRRSVHQHLSHAV